MLILKQKHKVGPHPTQLTETYLTLSEIIIYIHIQTNFYLAYFTVDSSQNLLL